MSIREQFEAWLSSEYQWANDTLNEAHFHGDDDTGYYTGGDFMYDGKSCSDALFWAWRGWQESHKQGEAKCAALAAELKQSQIDAGCYKKGMEASNERLAQVAAELSAVEAIHNEAVFITDDHYEQCPQEVQKIIRSLAVMQIPAYKVFLAEVRVQGVEMYASKLEECAKDAERGGFDTAAQQLRSEALAAREFAAQLRQEAAQ